ncbi:hypothetical protein A8C32_02095 [Flavivirga aquatica]|uniref:PKD domain-containing protein n=1 Tax=Flavivirga aquatica TaxID=1849968 RepID=A0A1E5TA53_9FLAO|nr:Ig-like domain-containing protein [Flavivirga aquatica]OEK08270.1 hypothetical protein A8C32_02095 [Flavivirga aquatica]
MEALILKKRIGILITILLCSFTFVAFIKFKVLFFDGKKGPEMTTQTWPAGTFLSNFPEGDRINTYHRNWMMISGQAGTGIWDISNPTAPKKIQDRDAANNGHRWWKINDLYYREYSVPEVQGTGYKYLDLSDMLDPKPITDSDVLYTVEEGNAHYDNLETFPHTIVGKRVFDMRSGEEVGEIPIDISTPDVVLRMGNYVFYAPQTGKISVFDFGNPQNIKFLGAFGENVPHEQYSTGFQVWRNNLVFMSGNNGPSNLVGFDISDPTNVKESFSLHSDDITLGRYMIFQDEFGFTGRFDRGVKYNFEKMEIEHEFSPPSGDEIVQFIDNQWMPIGHILVASGDNKTSIFAHQDGLDTNPPYVSHHFPKADEINLPITSTIGFVINETLDDLTLNDKTIEVSPLGGSPIEGDVSSSSYQVINYAPKQLLLPNTTYQVKFIEGGIKDAVGNGIKESIFYFTTGGDATNKSPEISDLEISTPSPIVKGSSVTFKAIALDPEGNSLKYRWRFNDGSNDIPFNNSNTTLHTFSKPGNYSIQVQVSDGNGGFSVFSKSIIVINKAITDLPTQSEPIAIDETRNTVWVANPDNNTVTQIDNTTLKVKKEIAVGKNPINIAIDKLGNAWVTLRGDDNISIISPTGTLLKKIQLKKGSQPYGIVFTPKKDKAFVSNYGYNNIVNLDVNTQSVKNTLKIGSTPRALAITANGKQLLVTKFISSASHGEVWHINVDNFTLNNTIELDLDTTTSDNGNQARGLPNYVSGITIHPTENIAWSVAKKDNILRGLNRDGKALTFDNTVRTAISKIDISTNTELFSNRIDIDNHSQPSSALYSPNGNYVFITMQGNNELIVINPYTGEEIQKQQVGKAPQGIAIDTSNNHVFVKNFMDRSVSVFDAQDMITNGSNTLNLIKTISTVSSEKLTSEILKGKQIFYDASDIRMGSDGYTSCATCHIDGEQDGRVWDFTDRGEGLRNTITLIGRKGTGHGNLHWSANFDEVQDFENDIRFHFKGQGFLSNSDFNESTRALTLGLNKAGKSLDLDALAAYVTSLENYETSPFRDANESLTTNGNTGKALFETLKCASCHGGKDFTDSALDRMHDVGTITSSSGNRLRKELIGIDVPSLKGLWNSAPYLHDGSAKTIAEIFTAKNASNSHTLSRLSSKQISDLEAYLLQLDHNEQGFTNTMELEMNSPKNNQHVTKDQDIPLSVKTNINGITKIQYFIDNELFSEVTTAPFEDVWKPIIWKDYKIRAKVYYNNGHTASVTPQVNFKFKSTVKALFVVGDKNNLSADDLQIKSRLEQKIGFKTTLISDDDATRPSIANPFNIVLISSTVDPEILGNDLEASRVPLITWDPFMYGKLKMVKGSFNEGYGFTQNATNLVTLNLPEHPISSNLGNTANIYNLNLTLPFGVPETEALIFAETDGKPIIFGYEAGHDQILSRRLAFPLRDQFVHLVSEEGWKLFEAAVIWTLHGGNANTPIFPLPDTFFKQPLDGDLINLPIEIDFTTLGWNIPSNSYRLRFLIDNNDRGFVSSEGKFIDRTNLSDGEHKLTLQMERTDGSITNLGETITIKVTSAALPKDPSAIFKYPTNGNLVGQDFDLIFSLLKFELKDGNAVEFFIDNESQGTYTSLAPIPVTSLDEGNHTLKIKLLDATGNEFGDESEISITVIKDIDQIVNSKHKIHYSNNSPNSSGSSMNPVFQIENATDNTELLKNFTIKYWFTPETSRSMKFNLNYSQIPGVQGTFVETGNNSYLELNFTDASGSIPPNSKTGIIQTRSHLTNYKPFDQSNDYSFIEKQKSLGLNPKITLYKSGTLVWGIEPIQLENNSFSLSVNENESIRLKIQYECFNNSLTVTNNSSLTKLSKPFFISDLNGRIVKNFMLNSKKTIIDVSHLNAGIYLVYHHTAKGIKSKKIVICD